MNSKVSIKVSSHGEQRARKRHGLPIKAVERQVQNAYARGKRRTEFAGSLRRYLDLLWHRGRDQQAGTDVVVYGNAVFLFARDGTLVTTWPLPPKYRNRKAVRPDRPVPDDLVLEFAI